MEFQKNELSRILLEKGWEVGVLDNYDFRHWAKLVWLLTSQWSPVGAKAYVAFLLDPQEIRPEKEFVWAIAIYSEPPLYGVSDAFTMTLNHWKKELPEFLNNLEKLRVQS